MRNQTTRKAQLCFALEIVGVVLFIVCAIEWPISAEWVPLSTRFHSPSVVEDEDDCGIPRETKEFAEAPSQFSESEAANLFGKLPLYFVKNQGQIKGPANYYIQGRDKALYFGPRGITFALTGSEEHITSRHAGNFPDADSGRQRWVLRLDFVGGNPDVYPTGQNPTPTKVSYFKGKRDQWNTGIPTYGKLAYRKLWPGIDLIYSGDVNELKYTFVVNPGGDPNRIKLAYRGATTVQLTESGQLEVSTPVGSFCDGKPYAYQEVGNRRVEVLVTYSLEEEAASENFGYSFKVGTYDKSKPLFLDPAILIYCGYIGGSSIDGGYGIAVDSSGNAYVTGTTYSSESTFPVTVGPDLSYNGGNGDLPRADVFVAKVNAAGTALDYCGYIGGGAWDYGNAIAVDSSGNAYVTGYTYSNETTFPVTVGPDLSHNGGEDVFVAKVSSFSRYFPVAFNSSTQTMGLAVVNLSQSTASLTFKAYSNSGTLVATGSRQLAPGRQLVLLIGQILSGLGDFSGWLVMESNVPNVEGFFLLFDYKLSWMDGAPVSGDTVKDFVLPAGNIDVMFTKGTASAQLCTDDCMERGVNLVNPSSSPVSGKLEFISEAGSVVYSKQEVIPALGRTTTLTTEVIPQGQRWGYWRFSGDGGVAALLSLNRMELGTPSWMAMAIPVDTATQVTTTQIPEQNESPAILYAPQYASGGGYTSVLDIVNLEDASTSLSLELIGDDGVAIGSTGSVTLPPRGSTQISSPSIFGITAGTELIQGYVKVQSVSGRFAGWVWFTDPAAEDFGSALRFVGTGLTTTLFSQVAQDDLYYTGLAALNPNSQAATVTVTVYDTKGSVVATGSTDLPAGGRISKLLFQLVGTFPDMTEGYFKVASTLPVVSFALFGTNTFEVLAAVPPQVASGK